MQRAWHVHLALMHPHQKLLHPTHQHHPLPSHNYPHLIHHSYHLAACHNFLHLPSHHQLEAKVEEEVEAVDVEVGGADVEEGAALVGVGRPLQVGETSTQRKRNSGQATSPV